MKKWLTLLFISLLLTACGNSEKSRAELIPLNGQPITLKDLRGKWVIINYWASWCKPCTKEIPQLNEFYQQNKDKNVILYGVNYDQVSSDKLKMLISEMHISYPSLAKDPAQSLGLGDIPGIPITFVINPEGKLVKKLLGEQTTHSLKKAIS